MRRSILSALLAMALVALAMPVLAGGYATVRLDELPGDVVAGELWRIGFTVRQHDITPTNDVTPIVRARHVDTGEEVTATARQEGPVGHFVADLTLPNPGAWKWAIHPEPFAETSFETLHVVDELDSGELESAPMATATETIEIVGGETDEWTFQPPTITIAPGETVAWVNLSEIAHTITSDDLRFADSGVLDPGQTFRQAFSKPGTFQYRCGPHPWMEGTVVVE